MKRGLMFFWRHLSHSYSYIKYILLVGPPIRLRASGGTSTAPRQVKLWHPLPNYTAWPSLQLPARISLASACGWSRRHRRDGANTTGGPISRPRSRRHCRVSGNPTGGLFLCHDKLSSYHMSHVTLLFLKQVFGFNAHFLWHHILSTHINLLVGLFFFFYIFANKPLYILLIQLFFS